MSEWEAVLTAALIGSERAVVPPPPPGFPKPEPSTDPAATILDQAALLTVARRAGCRPKTAEPPAAAGDDPRPAVREAAGRRLRRILGGENSELLHEWLNAAVAHGLRPPPELLPALLDRARRVAATNPDPDEARLRGLVATVGGARATWLASLNPAWSWLLAEEQAAPPQRRLTEADAQRAMTLADAQPDMNGLAQLMAIVPPPWPAKLAAMALTRASRALSQTPLSASRVIRLAGTRADPALGAPGALADFPPEAPQVLHNMLAVLRFRYEMLKELASA
ncbi:MAG TPA: DUF5691 domain-containing protein [Streptosporangiaceae bacterium]|nr:DUF5691 domain-containing protein [Streptosporangiaceae bacterium]